MFCLVYWCNHYWSQLLMYLLHGYMLFLLKCITTCHASRTHSTSCEFARFFTESKHLNSNCNFVIRSPSVIMGSTLSSDNTSKQRKPGKQPWYKNKSRRTSLLVSVAVFAFAVIFVASVQHQYSWIMLCSLRDSYHSITIQT